MANVITPTAEQVDKYIRHGVTSIRFDKYTFSFLAFSHIDLMPLISKGGRPLHAWSTGELACARMELERRGEYSQNQNALHYGARVIIGRDNVRDQNLPKGKFEVFRKDLTPIGLRVLVENTRYPIPFSVEPIYLEDGQLDKSVARAHLDRQINR